MANDRAAPKRRPEADQDLAESLGQYIPETDVQRWHRLMMNTNRVEFWLDRGVDKQTLRRLKIGWNGKEGRYTIPVRDVAGGVVDVKRYRPGATQYKNIHTKGFGRGARLFG